MSGQITWSNVRAASRTGYECLELRTGGIPDRVGAEAFFTREILPKLNEIHGGEVRPTDAEYVRAWTLFTNGWWASYLHFLAIRNAKENGRCP